jgi:hypothetical protein
MQLTVAPTWAYPLRCRGTEHIATIVDGIRTRAGGYDLVARHMLRTVSSEQVSVRSREVDKSLDVSPNLKKGIQA